jgi:threonine dehydrogenase-like Zn-dependent dehydrogenase
VSGLGLVGSFAAFLARLSAGKLIVIDPNPFRREKAAWIGADAIVGPDDAAEAINSLSDGRGVDMFIETSGAPSALQMAILNTATLGTIAVAAWYGTRPVQLSLSPEFHLRSLKIISIHVFNLDEGNRWNRERKFATSVDFLKNIDVAQLITHRVPFEDAPSAYRQLDEHANETLAVLLEHGSVVTA